jgi:hypothetical protein
LLWAALGRAAPIEQSQTISTCAGGERNRCDQVCSSISIQQPRIRVEASDNVAEQRRRVSERVAPVPEHVLDQELAAVAEMGAEPETAQPL